MPNISPQSATKFHADQILLKIINSIDVNPQISCFF